ncbi:MAG: hypothetical protein AAFZ07_04850 [Actinomycetota bacterium]
MTDLDEIPDWEVIGLAGDRSPGRWPGPARLLIAALAATALFLLGVLVGRVAEDDVDAAAVPDRLAESASAPPVTAIAPAGAAAVATTAPPTTAPPTTAPATTAAPPTTTPPPTASAPPTTVAAPATTTAPPTTVASVEAAHQALRNWWVLTSSGRLVSLEAGLAPKHSEVEAPVDATDADRGGWWVIDSEGRVTGWDGADSLGDLTAADGAPIVAITSSNAGDGYWVLRSDGTVTAFGDAADLGSLSLGDGVEAVGLAAAPVGAGYWIALDNGTVVPFGTAPSLPDARDLALAAPIVDIAAGMTGYWLLGADGGIFNYGEEFLGSGVAEQPLPGPARALGVLDDGAGYLIVTTDGELSTFGAELDLVPPSLDQDEQAIGLVRFFVG